MTKKKRERKERQRSSVTVRPRQPGGVSLYEFGGDGQFSRALELVKSLQYPCILCGEPEPGGIGCFMPNRDAVEKFSGPMAALREGKTRTLWYALCEECNNLEGAGDRVEARMGGGAA
ncbi:MAG TPA: hypothetical protein VGP38_00510 [Rubrobacter sp.]|nr:hypothetical protein [Rubrobacter sp.]